MQRNIELKTIEAVYIYTHTNILENKCVYWVERKNLKNEIKILINKTRLNLSY